MMITYTVTYRPILQTKADSLCRKLLNEIVSCETTVRQFFTRYHVMELSSYMYNPHMRQKSTDEIMN